MNKAAWDKMSEKEDEVKSVLVGSYKILSPPPVKVNKLEQLITTIKLAGSTASYSKTPPKKLSFEDERRKRKRARRSVK